MRRRVLIALGLSGLLTSEIQTQTNEAPLEAYRKLEFPPTPENFDKGWKERVALEFRVVNQSELGELRAGLEDPDPFVRSMAARALGIRADGESAGALASLALRDPEHLVRIRAVESLGLLKMKPDVIETVRKDQHAAVSWAADLAAEQLESDRDLAGQIRRAFAAGIERSEMGVAEIGKPAPDFEAQTLDGKTLRLSSVLGRKPIAIYFAAFDQ